MSYFNEFAERETYIGTVLSRDNIGDHYLQELLPHSVWFDGFV